MTKTAAAEAANQLQEIRALRARFHAVRAGLLRAVHDKGVLERKLIKLLRPLEAWEAYPRLLPALTRDLARQGFAWDIAEDASAIALMRYAEAALSLPYREARAWAWVVAHREAIRASVIDAQGARFKAVEGRALPRRVGGDTLLNEVDRKGEAPPVIAERRESLKALRVALATLPDQERMTLLLRVEGWTQQEVADRDGLSRQAVSLRERSAWQKLRKRL